MRLNYILVDMENVQPSGLEALVGANFRVLVFVGASQAKIAFEIVEAMQRLGSCGKYVRVTGHGKNALDFHIAFHLGRMVAADSAGYYHIISKDAGFDPLIAHLREQEISVKRVESIADIPLLKRAADLAKAATEKPAAKTVESSNVPTHTKQLKSPPSTAATGNTTTKLSDRVTTAVDHLKRQKAAKPRRVTTLTSTLATLFKNQLVEAEVETLVAELRRQKLVTVNGGTVSYSLG